MALGPTETGSAIVVRCISFSWRTCIVRLPSGFDVATTLEHSSQRYTISARANAHPFFDRIYHIQQA